MRIIVWDKYNYFPVITFSARLEVESFQKVSGNYQVDECIKLGVILTSYNRHRFLILFLEDLNYDNVQFKSFESEMLSFSSSAPVLCRSITDSFSWWRRSDSEELNFGWWVNGNCFFTVLEFSNIINDITWWRELS